MVQWIIGLNLHGGANELFLAQASAPQLVYLVYYPVCGMVHIKEPLLLMSIN